MAVIGRDWRVIHVNAAAEALVHMPREQLVGRDVRELHPQAGDAVFLDSYRRAMEERVPVHFEGQSSVLDAWLDVFAYPSAHGLTILFRDVTERHEREEKLRSLSVLDELTGLYNRRGFFTLAHQHCRLAERKHRGALLVFVDMDSLKQINDTLGHAAGDRALTAVSAALRESFRESDILGRLGGDEFAALALETDREAAPLLLDRLRAALEAFNAGRSLPIPLSVSVGTAYFDPGQPCGVEELITTADHEMYEEKRTKLRATNYES